MDDVTSATFAGAAFGRAAFGPRGRWASVPRVGARPARDAIGLPLPRGDELGDRGELGPDIGRDAGA
ncbi:MAG: hypothetical protein WA794_21170, partial [Trebonia sp.]